jgi:hypothetical protein
MKTILPSNFLDNNLNRIDTAVANSDIAKLQAMKVLDNDECFKDTLNVDGEHFYFGGQLVSNVVYFNVTKTKRLLIRFGIDAKIEEWGQ